MIYCIFFGATSGAYTVLTPVILIDLIGLDRFTLAYGLDLLAMGMGTIIGPPLAGNTPCCSFTKVHTNNLLSGAIHDATGSNHAGFYFSGFTILVSGLMFLPFPWILQQDKNGEKKPLVPQP